MVSTRNAASGLAISRARLKRIVSAGNVASFALAAWTLFLPAPYALAILVCIAVPLLGIAFDAWTGGKLDWQSSTRKATPYSLAIVITMPALALCARALSDLNTQDWPLMIAWALGAGLGCLACFVLFDARVRNDWRQLATLAIFSLAYAYGALAYFDTSFDPWPSRETATAILDMRVRVSGGVKGSSIWHEVRIGSAASPGAAGWVHVRPDVYGELGKGMIVCVHSGRGLLFVRWFELRRCGQ